MVETITPVVHGGRARWLEALAVHAMSVLLTAALFGAALGWIGGLLGAPWGGAGLIAVAGVAAAYAVTELAGLRMPVPQLRRQVPDWWRTFYGRPIAAALYGAGLGVGFLTYLAHGTLVVVAFAAIASGRSLVGAAFLAPFGLLRGLSPVVAWRSDSSERSRALVDRLASSPVSRRRAANGSVLIVLGVVAIAASIGAAAGGWAQLAAAALAGIWAWAAISKLVAGRRWRRALAAHRLPPTVEAVAAWAMPLVEACVPVLVVAGMPAAAGVLALVLTGGFTVAVVQAPRVAGDLVPCGCFGGSDAVEVRAALARNAGIAALSGFVLLTGRDAPIAWPGVPAPADAVPLALATVALAASAVTAWRVSVWLGRGRSA